MAYTDETRVREHSGLGDATAVPAELVARAIEDAHETVLRDLDPVWLGSGDAVLALAETEIATAFLFRSLAGRAAGLGRELRTMHLRTGEVARAPVLLRLAEDEEARGRGRLGPYLEASPEAFGFGLAEPGGG